MNTKTTKIASKSASPTATNGTANGKVKHPIKKQGAPQREQEEHAARGGKALLKAWRRIAERSGEGY